MNAKSAPIAVAIDAILTELKPHLASASQVQQARTFVERFFSRISEDDLAARDTKSWAALLRGLMDFLRIRAANVPSVAASASSTNAISTWSARMR